MLFNIGDLVTRKSHNNDVTFEILRIEDRIAYLKGKDIRLYADSPPEDLKLEKNALEKKDDDNELIDTITSNFRLDRKTCNWKKKQNFLGGSYRSCCCSYINISLC